jgi:hypothetical protein
MSTLLVVSADIIASKGIADQPGGVETIRIWREQMRNELIHAIKVSTKSDKLSVTEATHAGDNVELRVAGTDLTSVANGILGALATVLTACSIGTRFRYTVFPIDTHIQYHPRFSAFAALGKNEAKDYHFAIDRSVSRALGVDVALWYTKNLAQEITIAYSAGESATGTVVHAFCRIGEPIPPYPTADSTAPSTVVRPRRRQSLEPLEMFEAIATELSGYHSSLNERVFLLRMLPFEFTQAVLRPLGIQNYELLKAYKSAVTHIVRGGNPGGGGFWDVSIFGVCPDQPSIDAATTRALLSEYFPVLPDEFEPDWEEETIKSANTSILALSKDPPIESGLFIIGSYSKKGLEEGNIKALLKDVAWRIGFSFILKPHGSVFTGRWLQKCQAITTKSGLAELVHLWSSVYDRLETPVTEPPPSSRVDRIVIDLDATHDSRAGAWREFLKAWYKPD